MMTNENEKENMTAGMAKIYNAAAEEDKTSFRANFDTKFLASMKDHYGYFYSEMIKNKVNSKAFDFKTDDMI